MPVITFTYTHTHTVQFGVAVLDLALEGSCGATIRLLRHAGIMGWGRGTGSAAASIL